MSCKLPKKLKNSPFSFSQATKIGLSRYDINCLIEEEAIFRVDRGIYQPSDLDFSEENQFKLASLILGKDSAICLLSALSYYELTDVIPRKVWVMVPVNKRSMRKSLHLFRARSPKWNVGIIKKSSFQITSLERTLIDCFLNDKYFSKTEIIHSIKESLRNRLTSGTKILKMSDQLGVKSKILPYLEVII